jgi:hypothetical protein
MKKSAQKIAAVCLAACLLMIAIPSAHAEEQAGADKNWELNLTPMYLWFVDMSGTMGVKNMNVPVDVPFGDIFDNLEAILTGHFEALHRSHWGLILDLSYLDIGSSVPADRIQKVDFVSVIAEADGFYRFDMGYQAIDILAGIRYNSLEPKITFTPGLPLSSLKTTEDWIDPIVGGRYLRELNDQWTLILRADIGGFGVGSDFVWNVSGLVDYRPWKHVSIIGGYKALDTDYKNSNGTITTYDVRLAGPVLGLNFFW